MAHFYGTTLYTKANKQYVYHNRKKSTLLERIVVTVKEYGQIEENREAFMIRKKATN